MLGMLCSAPASGLYGVAIRSMLELVQVPVFSGVM